MIAIIDYGVKNKIELKTILNRLNAEFCFTKSEADVLKSDKVIIPDAENIKNCIKRMVMSNLTNVIKLCRNDVLAINNGMLLLADYSYEAQIDCLGRFNFPAESFETKPQQGFYSLCNIKNHKLFDDISEQDKFFFSNSSYIRNSEITLAEIEHPVNFSAVVKKDNFYGFQFNPELSDKSGEKILQNFINL